MNAERDLANPSDLQEYLASTPFAAEELEVLTGGTANPAFRVILKTPYEGHKTLVVKHGKPYFTTSQGKYPFALERQNFEVESLKNVAALLPADSLVTVPKVHLFDEKENVIIMDDCGAQSITLKQFVLDGKCTFDLAEKIGSAVGTFLGGLHHTWGKNNSARLLEALRKNEQGKTISSWAIYGRLVQTLTPGGDPTSLVCDEPPEVSEEDKKTLERVAKTMSEAILSANDTFVMGDFWPGNILLAFDESGQIERIFVIDWELAKPGLQGLDVGQFCAEIDLLRRFHPELAEGVSSKIISSFFQSYSYLDESNNDKDNLYRTAVTHWGAHLVVWTPRVSWGSKDETRRVVKAGVEQIVKFGRDDGSLVREMFRTTITFTQSLGRIAMESSPTDLYLPQSFPYPIKVVSIDAKESENVERGTRLLSYTFIYTSRVPGSKPETRFGTWDCAVEGSLQKWNIKPGDTISQRHAKEKPVAVVIEPCKHGMQLGGLCVLCGKDMTNADYIGLSDESRASIQMTHSAFGPTVSLEEAQRIERETAERLLKARKLSLIVDLDQTIVHATVDPTVGEWISEGEAWESRRAQKAENSEQPADSEDECNPNWEALKDVKKFRLGPESFGVPQPTGKNAAGKGVGDQGCMYYIKPRPGWETFLREAASKYEMHVYTMGTRAYAEQVCAAIDPDGSLFGGRILSRDESGSLTQKSLQRLFPCDTSMVVIIDDRADVWEWSPNLIKVVPYDFFVGIGDINSAFLPKLEPLTAATPSPSTIPSTVPTKTGSLTPEPVVEVQDSSRQTSKEAMITQNSLALEAQVEERPLAKRQEALQDDTPKEPPPKPPHDQASTDTSSTAKSDDGNKEQADTNTQAKPEKIPRKALLKNDDAELDRVYKLLNIIHERFFTEYDARNDTSKASNSQRRKSISSNGPSYDVKVIIPSIRKEVLRDVHLLFSSVIPLDTRPESTEIWRMAEKFGAKCSTELTPDITHVVAAKRGTVKVEAARKRPNIKVVWLAWFTDSIALWRRQDETPYLLDDPAAAVAGPSSSPSTSPTQISSDPDIDDDEDWELEGNAVSGGVSLGPSQNFSVDQINWDDINDEVDAAMAESDDDEDDMASVKSAGGVKSGNVSGEEEEWSDESNSVISNNNSPRPKRKRLRSLTPSENGVNGDPDVLRSPLSKRKKLAADRSGFSRLKEAISAEDLRSRSPTPSRKSSSGRVTPRAGTPRDGDDDDDDDVELEDDFLAREMEEEWG
ncbi:CTD phosphatase Fcp1 [Paramarasmius palmivorus]|uniref:protein-serine/threonine phosphatase n=1 Tax=Paramarasmius palmivorus TaxID=297713 RepID=A0AAW0E2S8_9AGAR